MNDEMCARMQEQYDGENLANDEDDDNNNNYAESTCSEPAKKTVDGRETWFRSCLSAPFTLTPGGVVNCASVVHYPFSTNRRVVLGRRIWEFVEVGVGGNAAAEGEQHLRPAPVNRLYVHHILGSVIQGNGAESINRSDKDTVFPEPYGRLTGDFGDVMTFHLINLRGSRRTGSRHRIHFGGG